MGLETKLRGLASICLLLAGTISVQGQEDPSQSPIQFHSKQDGRYLVGENAVLLKEDAVVTMEGMELKAYHIKINYEKHLLTAYGIRQADGSVIGRPRFTQGDRTFGADTMRYNYVSQKGWVFQGNTTENGGYLHGDQIKMVEDSSYFLGSASFTTCNHEHPHFAIVTKKARLDVGKRIVTGPAFLTILDLPTPLGLPFAFFPIMDKQASGFILPTFADKRDWGLGLIGGGYYWSFNDHYDLRLTGDVYSQGSYGVQATSNYRFRYRYSGNLGLQINRTKFGDPRQTGGQFMDSKDYRVTWSHSQDAKAHPSQQFSARVELATGSFFRNTTTNPQDFQKNDMSSSISYTKRWPGSPFSLTAAARHRQNNQNGTLSLSLPDVNFGMSRIQPFARRNPVGGTRWYEKIGLTYSMQARNETNGLLTELATPARLFSADRLRSGVNHSASLGTNIKVLRFITVNPNANYQERWYPYALDYRWDSVSESVQRDTVTGFFSAREYGVSAGASTTVYGIFNLKRGPVKAIRHMMYPSVSWRYVPDFTQGQWNAFQTVQSDTAGTLRSFSRYQGFIYGAPGVGNQGGINFRLRNTLDGKWSRGDSGAVKKFNLLEDFTLSSNYNPLLDSNPLSPVAVRASTSFLKNKIRLTYQGNYDWYAIDSSGLQLNSFAWTEGQGPLRPTLHQLSVDLRFRGGSSSGRPMAPMNEFGLEQDLYPDYYDYMPMMDWHAPWTFNMGYSLRQSAMLGSTDMKTTQSVRMDASWEPTANWRLGVSTGYDVKAMDFTFTTVDVLRQLHCWEMRIRWVPFGYARSYNIGIGVKAPLMSALKLERRRGIGDY
ncbi:MAG: putative LPS assembly protein LptD [Schleiferiaceae bacterium]|nr:putative LPS assembly protein LptD [Schleiferiaceae bacterium]